MRKLFAYIKLFRKLRKAKHYYLYIKLLRPKQWIKNLLVFAALIFSIPNTHTNMLLQTMLAFLLFSFTAGSVYIFNDYMDKEADKNHPVKKHRPLAAGRVNPKKAIIFGILLITITLASALLLNQAFALIISSYFILNLFYTWKLKMVVLLDVMIIATGFVLRAIAGGVIIHRQLTPWFFIVIMMLALFLAISKRRQEINPLRGSNGSHRIVLHRYSPALLDQLNNIAATGTITSYALFTFTSGHTIYLMLTIPFVIYGIFRYLYLLLIEEITASVEDILTKDKHILFTLIAYVLSVVLILWYFD